MRQNLCTYLRRLSSVLCGKKCRSLTCPGRLYPPWNTPMNCSQMSLQDWTEFGGSFMSHYLAFGFKAKANQLSMTFSSRRAARQAIEYTCKNSIGFVFPSNLSDTSGQKLFGHFTWQSSGMKARHPSPWRGAGWASSRSSSGSSRLGTDASACARFGCEHLPQPVVEFILDVCPGRWWGRCDGIAVGFAANRSVALGAALLTAIVSWQRWFRARGSSISASIGRDVAGA
jgi:hypothetical protein